MSVKSVFRKREELGLHLLRIKFFLISIFHFFNVEHLHRSFFFTSPIKHAHSFIHIQSLRCTKMHIMMVFPCAPLLFTTVSPASCAYCFSALLQRQRSLCGERCDVDWLRYLLGLRNLRSVPGALLSRCYTLLFLSILKKHKTCCSDTIRQNGNNSKRPYGRNTFSC